MLTGMLPPGPMAPDCTKAPPSPFRQKPEDIGRMYVKGTNDAMIPVSALTRTEFRSGPTLLTRFNGFTAALVTTGPRPGHSSGELMQQLDELIPPERPKGGTIKTMVRRGEAYEQIIQLALEGRSDLVIMAVRGRGALNLAVFGSTTYRVIQLGPCPVLAVHV